MFSCAVKHRVKKADMEARNKQNLSPLTLASKLGRVQLFNEITQLQSYVSEPSVSLLRFLVSPPALREAQARRAYVLMLLFFYLKNILVIYVRPIIYRPIFTKFAGLVELWP